jgi:hypothetical protein
MAKKKTTPKKTSKKKPSLEIGGGDMFDFLEQGEGTELTGFYKGSETIDIAGQGESLKHSIILDDKENTQIDFWGSTVLDSKLSKIRSGALITIVFTGMGKKKGRKQAPKLFKVLVCSKADLL